MTLQSLWKLAEKTASDQLELLLNQLTETEDCIDALNYKSELSFGELVERSVYESKLIALTESRKTLEIYLAAIQGEVIKNAKDDT